MLRAIAFHFLDKDLLEADLETIGGVVEPLLGGFEVRTSGREVVEQIWQRSGILAEQAIGRFGFAHRALLDYLAAEYVEKHELDERLLAHVAEERWREVILIATGLVPPGRAKRLVKELIGREDAGAQELEIAGLSLAEDVQLGEDLRAEVRQRLQERLAKEGSPAAFGRLATALMVADLDTASKWMGEVQRGGDPGLRLRVLGLLPELGEGHAKALVPLLGQLFGASDEDATVRSQAALALAGIGVEPDAAIWQTLGAARGDTDLGLRRAATWAWCEFGRFAELELVEVPAGEFVMGSDDMENWEKPAHRPHLPTFYIGRYPVTVVEFREFVDATGHQPADRRCL